MSKNCDNSTNNSATSSGSAAVARSGIIFCVVGAAASGKTTLISKLLGEFLNDMQRAVSVTSRSMRPGEVEGQSYFFVSRGEFEARVAAGEFFEWEETHGNLYGTQRSAILQTIDRGHDLVLDIDIRGARNFQKAWPQRAVTILIVPPSGQEFLARLKGRGAISEQELATRIESAQREYQTFRQLHGSGEVIDYLLINAELEAAYDTLRAIVLAERSKISRRSIQDVARLCSVVKA